MSPVFRPYDLPAEGGCRCGALRFRLTAQPLSSALCHCTGCQKMSASAFSATLMVPADAFEVTRGTPVKGGLKADMPTHWHCPECLSWVYTTLGEGSRILNLRATMLDDASRFVPFLETWTSEKLPWVETPALHSFPQFPARDEVGPLLREYAARVAASGGPA